MRRVLVVAAHPDDEVLGCGGTLAFHVSQGDTVHVLYMGRGESARNNDNNDTLEVQRLKNAEKACQILGISGITKMDFPDNRLDSCELLDLVKAIERCLEKVQPEIIYTHCNCDLNIDHRLVHQAVLTACRPLPTSTVREIYGFEILSSTGWLGPKYSNFSPALYVDIEKVYGNKQRALEAYAAEMREEPHARSMEAVEVLARHRGYSVGMAMAEAFEIYRILK